MENVSLYSEARNEYLKQLSTWIVPPVVEFYRKEYGIIAAREGKKAMSAFQNYCAEVPKWNQDVIEINIATVLETCRCDYMEELMTAVFIAHTKMLTAIRVSSKQKKMKITLPKLDHFLHRFFIECARAFWKAPFLFSEEYSPIEKQKNVLQIEAMCIDALSGAVRSLLPVKSILTEYLEDSDDSSDSESDETLKPQSQTQSQITPVQAAPVQAVPQTTPVQTVVTPSLVMSEVAESNTEQTKEEQTKDKTPIQVTKAESAPPPSLVLSETSDNNDSIVMDNKVSSMPVIPDKHIIEKIDVPPNTPAQPTQTQQTEPSRLLIDTEPSVHFTPFDTVYDENSANISEIRYTPKVSVEDKPPSMWGLSDYSDDLEEMDDFDSDNIELPRLNIQDNNNQTGSELNMDDFEDLDSDKTKDIMVEEEKEDEDIDVALADSNDFEELG